MKKFFVFLSLLSLLSTSIEHRLRTRAPATCRAINPAVNRQAHLRSLRPLQRRASRPCSVARTIPTTANRNHNKTKRLPARKKSMPATSFG